MMVLHKDAVRAERILSRGVTNFFFFENLGEQL